MAFTLFAPIREYFSLRGAERVVRAYSPVQHTLVKEHVEAGRQRLSAGRRTTPPIPAAVLLREALRHYLMAAALVRNPTAELAHVDLADAMPPLAPDPVSPRADPTDDALARAALASDEALFFDHLAPALVERTRWALDRAGGMARGGVEARSLTNLRAARWGRRAAVVLVVLYGVLTFVRARYVPKDIALNKPVHASSRKHNPPDGRELVDGDIGTSYGIHTNTEDSPNVVIDLQGRFWLSSVKVHNRVDGWFDDCLPLVVEISMDGKDWALLGRRTDHFDANPPWVIDGGGRPARFVRVRVDRKSYLAISEVEVYGKP